MISRSAGTSNTGGKSRGCASCKKRKIKCDQSKPACTQCLKSGWVCPGYPSVSDLVFRNQTGSLVQKLHRGFSPSIVDRATAFFISQYVFQRHPDGSTPPSRGHYEYLPALLHGESSSSVLTTTVAAAGLAGLANAGNSNAWRIDAHAMHGLAICRLKEALEDPCQATSNKTLVAIVLMGTFEQIASADASSMHFFSQHIMAVAKCIELHGSNQFQSVVSIGLLGEIRRLVIMTLHRLQEPVPPALEKWSSWTGNIIHEDEAPANSFGVISSQLVAVRAKLKQKAICDPTVVAEMLLPIDEKLETWRSELPWSWKYKSYTAIDSTASSGDTYQSHYDVYEDLWVASVWNSYRTSRLLLYEHIMSTTLKYGSAEDNDMLQAAAKVLKAMADEICHSVPFHLGIQRHRNSSSFQDSDAIPGCYLLIWPLFASGMRRTTPWQQKEWIVEKLRYIGTRMGLRLAMSMADRVAMEKRPSSGSEVWVMGEWYPK